MRSCQLSRYLLVTGARNCDDVWMGNVRAWRGSVVYFACAIVGACLANCSKDTNGSVSGACHDLMSTYCNWLASCDPIALQRQFGDVGTCVTRENLACAGVTLTGTGWTADKLQQCSAQFSGMTCTGNVGSVGCPTVHGTLPEGTPCEQSAQCASNGCTHTVVASPDGSVSNPGCGVCSSPVDAGPPPGCGDGGACQSPERCVYSNGTSRCMSPLPEGAPCSATTTNCDVDLFCKQSASDAGTAVCTKRGAAGAACTGYDECEHTPSLSCIAGTCSAPTFVPVGGACDNLGLQCEKGAHCSYPSPRPPSGTGTCQAPAEDGSPCDSTNGPYCLVPANCRDGICHLPGDAQCR
jgi:hypothetical protein